MVKQSLHKYTVKKFLDTLLDVLIDFFFSVRSRGMSKGCGCIQTGNKNLVKFANGNTSYDNVYVRRNDEHRNNKTRNWNKFLFTK